jgi:hypothetical protein
VTYSSGGLYADSVVVADVNGDGKPDLVVANSCAFNQGQLCANGSAGVLLGNGDGTFQAALSYLSPGQFALSLVVGDVNQDGKPDVLLYNSSKYTVDDYLGLVNLLLGNGDGTFRAATSYDFGGNALTQNPHGEALALADVNGDGKPDLLVTSTCYGYPSDPQPCVGQMVDGSVGVFLNVSSSPTSTTLSSSSNPSVFGQTVTFAATVTAQGSGTPTGTVAFTWGDAYRRYTIGTATLNSSGVATLVKSNLNADTYPLSAVYKGDANNLRSTSPVLNQVIIQATSAATLTSSPNPSASGQAVTFTATITSPTVMPTGPVTFAVGKKVLGTAQLSRGKARFTISTLAVGSTKVTATYYGNSNIAKSSASVTQTVH